MNLGGRPTIISDAIVRKIVKLLRDGNYFDTACKAAGISVSSGYAWRERGQRYAEAQALGVEANPDDEPYFRFLESVEKASAEAEAEAVALVKKAAKSKHEGEWQAAAWYLERRNTKAWGRRMALQHTGADDGPIQHHHEFESLDEYISRLSEADLKRE